jgi:hypothetical protein
MVLMPSTGLALAISSAVSPESTRLVMENDLMLLEGSCGFRRRLVLLLKAGHIRDREELVERRAVDRSRCIGS